MLRKIGGIYFLAIGPFRISFCKVKSRPITIAEHIQHTLIF